MTGKAKLWVAIAPLLIALSTSAAQSTASRTASLPVGRCINMGNHLEPPAEAGWGGRKIADNDFAIIARAGFDTVRIPVRWSSHADAKPPHKIDRAFMNRVKHVVTLAEAAGLNVILNSHHFEQIHKEPLEAAPQLAAMWSQIATEFQNFDRNRLWFEIENEPHDKFDDSNLLEVLTPALAELRKTNPDRPVIIGGQKWSGIDSLATLKLPDDPHIVPTFHYYDPFDFTHQGAEWNDPPPPIGRKWPTGRDAEQLAADVEKIRLYISRTGKTPFMGETGVHTTVSLDERVAYHRGIREAFDPLAIGICAWAFTNTMPLYDSASSSWLRGILEAMGVRPR